MLYLREIIPSGAPGTAATLRKMAALTNAAIADTQPREAGIAVIGSVDAATQAHAILGIREFVRSHLRLVADPGELLISPLYALAQISAQGWTAGDCDDAAMLVASLLASIGFSVRFRAVGSNPDGSFVHVFCEVLRESNPPYWLPVDPTVVNQPIISVSARSIIQSVN